MVSESEMTAPPAPDERKCEMCGEWSHGVRLWKMPGDWCGKDICPWCWVELLDEPEEWE
jgi:hypothetical protein